MTTIPDTPTPQAEGPFTVQARELLNDARAIRTKISGFRFGRLADRKRLNLSAGVPDRFLQTVAVALEASPSLAAASNTSAHDLREAIQFSREFLNVAEELELIAKGLRNTIALRRVRADQDARQVYALAKSFNRPSDREPLVPHIDAMRRALVRRRRSAASPDMPSEPEPAPQPAATPMATAPAPAAPPPSTAR